MRTPKPCFSEGVDASGWFYCRSRQGVLALFSWWRLTLPSGPPLLAQQPSLGAMEVVPQAPQRQGPVEGLDKFLPVETIVTQKQAHVGVVALLDMRVVVLAVGPERLSSTFGSRPLKWVTKWALRNSVPLSKASLRMAKGRASSNSRVRPRVANAPRFHTALTSVQPLWMSVASSAQTMAPAILPPHRATVSISKAPGRFRRTHRAARYGTAFRSGGRNARA